MSFTDNITDTFLRPERYKKFFAALAIPAGVLLLAMAPIDGQEVFEVTRIEWYGVIVALAGAFGVRQAPKNKDI